MKRLSADFIVYRRSDKTGWRAFVRIEELLGIDRAKDVAKLAEH
jgi:hypothetical protein